MDPTRLNSAFDKVMRTEANNGMVDGMLGQPFWERREVLQGVTTYESSSAD